MKRHNRYCRRATNLQLLKDTTATDYTPDVFFLFRDFNDGRYPRYYEKNATTFWGPFSFRVVFCGEMLGIPK